MRHCAVALGLVLASGLVWADQRLDLRQDPLACRVGRTAEGGVALGRHAQMMVGMELVLVADGAPIGRVRVNVVENGTASASLVSGQMPRTALTVMAAPLPFPVTSVDGQVAGVAGSAVLSPGDALTIARKGRVVATGRFVGHMPRQVEVTRLADGEGVQVGDLCYLGTLAGAEALPAVSDETEALTPVAPAPAAPAETLAVPAVPAPPAPQPPTTTPQTAGSAVAQSVVAGEAEPHVAPAPPREPISEPPSAQALPAKGASWDAALAAGAVLALLLTGNGEADNVIDNYDTRFIAPLPGCQFGVTPTGEVGIDGALHLTVPTAYTPAPGAVVFSASLGSTQRNRLADATGAAEATNGSAALGLGFQIAGHRGYVCEMPTSVRFEDIQGLQLQLVEEQGARPAIAVGVSDILAARGPETNPHSQRSFYVVGTRQLSTDPFPAYLTLGYGTVRYHHLFGAISLQPWPRTNCTVEYDTYGINLGVTHRIWGNGKWSVLLTGEYMGLGFPGIGLTVTMK